VRYAYLARKYPRLAGTILATLIASTVACNRVALKSDGTYEAGGTSTAKTNSAESIDVATALDKEPLLATPLTSIGNNSQGRFSPDGKRVIFVSDNRTSHRQAQIYEIELSSWRERRLTFHDGDDASPDYARDGQHFAFSSTTDEGKENSQMIDRLIRTYAPEGKNATNTASSASTTTAEDQPFEVYFQDLHGKKILRMTDSKGWDSDLDLDPSGKSIAFSSKRGRSQGDSASLLIYLMTTEGKNARTLTVGNFHDHGARFSPDGKRLAWIRDSIDENSGSTGTSKVMVTTLNSKPPKPIFEVVGQVSHIAWHPDGKEMVFSWNKGDSSKKRNLFVINLDGSCLRPFSETKMNQLTPDFSPDGKRLLFSGMKNEQSHLFIIDYRTSASCPEIDTQTQRWPLPGPSASPAPPPANRRSS
jgi:Tol biopolymer transport system component